MEQVAFALPGAVATYSAKSALFTASQANIGTFFDSTGSFTITIDTTGMSAGWSAWFHTVSGTQTLDPTSTTLINGASTYAMSNAGDTVLVEYTGSAFVVSHMQRPSTVAITGGSINATTIGAVTPSTGAFTTLNASSATAGATGSVGSIVTAGGIYAAAQSFFNGQLVVERSASTNNYGAGQVTGEAQARLTMRVDGLFGFGDGTSTRDVGFSRNAAGVLEINSSSAGTLRDLTLRNLTSSTTIAGATMTLASTTDATAAAGAFQCDGGARITKRLVFSGTSSFSGGITTGYIYNSGDGLGIIGTNGATYSMFFTNAAGSGFLTNYAGVSSVAIGAAASLPTNSTDGFPYIPTCAGTPIGTPTTRESGNILPLIIDRTNNKLYFYSGGAWRDAGP